jgi:hypothetical protein
MLIISRPVPLIIKALDEYSILSVDNVTLNAALAAFINRELKRSKLATILQHDLNKIKESLIRLINRMYVLFLITTDYVYRVNIY